MNTKICAKCKQSKPLDDFYYNEKLTSLDKRHSYCRPCVKQYNDARYAETKRKRAEARALSGEPLNKRGPKPLPAEEKARRHAANLEKYKTPQYRYRLEDPALLASLTTRECQLCGRTDVDVCVDHDHACCNTTSRTCGKCSRGVVCHSCNVLIGIAESEHKIANPEVQVKIDAYLEAYQTRRQNIS